MSKYDAEWMLTYFGGPILVLAGLAMGFSMAVAASRTVVAGSYIESAAISIFGIAIAVGLVGYGVYVFREGRKTLASTHWRAADFW